MHDVTARARERSRITRDPVVIELTRRSLIAGVGALGLLGWAGCAADSGAPEPELESVVGPAYDFSELDATLRAMHGDPEGPGLAVALIAGGATVWSGAFGRGDIGAGRARTVDDLQNIGSVTKTFTTTLALQQVEKGALTLDGDVQQWLDFPVRNPRHRDAAVTLRQLLVHRSGILDSDAYDGSYRCGDQDPGALGEFLRATVGSGEAEHWHEWAPGTLEVPEQPRAYSNVAFGLIGHLVERVTGRSYEEELAASLLRQLGMTSSGVRVADIDAARHVVPYSMASEEALEMDRSELLARGSAEEQPVVPGEWFGHCLYSFATPPDGLLRTSAIELARFVAAWAGGGAVDGQRVLREETVRMALAPEHLGRALCWSQSSSYEGEPFFLHGGGDPGIATVAAFRPQQQTGLVMLNNTSEPGYPMRDMVVRIAAELDRIAG